MIPVFGVVTFMFFVGLFWFLGPIELFSLFQSGEALTELALRTAGMGPLFVIALMAVAIVVSPLPSAPIALAAGVVYGHLWGTIYVIFGAELGALIAFKLARGLGLGFLKRWVDTEQLSLKFVGTQNTLMMIVFASRLMPFISFDLVSYAAGFSSLRTWRFAIATLAGIAPASFLLTHFGEELSSFDTALVLRSVLLLGGITGLSVLLKKTVFKRPGKG